MSFTRRKLLTVGTAVALPLLSGCSLDELATENETTTPESTLTVRLVGSDTQRRLFDQTSVASVGEVHESETGEGVGLPLIVSEEAASQISTTFQSAGVAETPDQFKIAVRQGDHEITQFDISPSLADQIARNDWDGKVRLSFERPSNAETVQRALVCGVDSDSDSCNST